MALPEPAPGSVALVTGASSGIGAAIARELANRGHDLVLVARREDRLEELCKELIRTHSVRADPVGADLADQSGRDGMARAVEKGGLEVAILVNNAGFGTFGRFWKQDREGQDRMVALNAQTVVDLTARYLPAMVERGSGAVINIVSTSAFQPLPGNATYAATKAFVLSHSEAVHEELKGTGVTMTAVCPGPVRTEFTEAAGVPQAEERTPGFVWMSAEDLARDAVRAADKGKRRVIPGLINQAGAMAGRHSPRRFSLPITRRIMGRAR